MKKKKHSILVAANVAKVPAIHGVGGGYANTSGSIRKERSPGIFLIIFTFTIDLGVDS
ncbi:MAG: hypothetical protein ACLSH6_05320 [Limosilactobacillus pontis]